MNRLICTEEAPCWMPGTGFRWLKDTGSTCAIDDEPLTKFDSLPRGDAMAALRMWFDGPDAVTIHQAAPAPVPLPDSGALMLALICAALARPAWRAAGRFGDWFTAERGAGPGRNGWV